MTSRWTWGCYVFSVTHIWHSTDLTRNWFYVSQKHLRAIEKDRKPYTLEVDEVKVQESILKRDLSKSESSRLSRQLSKRYPGLPITQALRNENEMLRQELERMRVGLQPHILKVQLVALIPLCFGVDGMSTSIFIASTSTSIFIECTEAIYCRGLIASNLPTQEWEGCWSKAGSMCESKCRYLSWETGLFIVFCRHAWIMTTNMWLSNLLSSPKTSPWSLRRRLQKGGELSETTVRGLLQRRLSIKSRDQP